MKTGRCLLLSLCWLVLGACSHISRQETRQAEDYAEQARSSAIPCPTDCAIESPLLALGDAAFAASTATQPRHKVVMLDQGQDSLLARVHLIRAARRSIDLQMFHFARDDSGQVVLDELLAAVARGVKVRVLMDQLNGLSDPQLQAKLTSYHRNFEMRVYNPIFLQAEVSPFEFAGGVLFRFRDLNRRMHNKMMVVDDRVAVIGGRNIQDEYFDWHETYNYRDRDLLVAGPECLAMKANFEVFWTDKRALPPSELADVARVLLQNKGPPDGPRPSRSARVKHMAVAAANSADVFARLLPYLYDVGRVEFFGDPPTKHDLGNRSRDDASQALLEVLGGAQRELLLQTPYLVMSRPARKLFRELHERPVPLSVLVSTNSLAATDAFPVYAMSHKYKRMFLRELGFQIYEYKPFPADMPIDLAAVPGVEASIVDDGFGLRGSGSGSGQGPVPLKRAGVRIGLHSKSMVVDEQIAIVGSHNFDPRSADYNTESLVMVHDPVFARALADSIRRDMEPGNSWVVAAKVKLPVFAQANYNLGKLSEQLPIFDVWPWPYATSYELKPGCRPLPPSDPGFHSCYVSVGDFPEVNLTMKMIYTRVLTVFGAGFIPIL
jgi:phosphatidylserine/phosphatidylglycerophosphate/cardiolipin synthase-like enzyme